jgi:hypothetical protein
MKKNIAEQNMQLKYITSFPFPQQPENGGHITNDEKIYKPNNNYLF